MKYLLACLIFKDGIIALLALGGVLSSGVLGWGFVENVLYGIWASVFAAIGGLWLAGVMDQRVRAAQVDHDAAWACWSW